MNLLLFANEESLRHIEPSDPRLEHVRNVLRLRAGDRLYAGVLGDKRAWATILRDDPQQGMFTEPQWEPHEPPQPLPLRVLAGLPRPQTARRILFEAAALGVARLDFFQAQKGEPSYAQSSLWHTDEWRERLLLGATQACVTSLPQVRHFPSLAAALATDNSNAPDANTPDPCACTRKEDIRLALDVYEAVAPLSHLLPTGLAPGRQLTLALGAERGWDAQERATLLEHDFLLTHIGQRVLRAETAFIAAVTLAADKMLHTE